MELKYFNENVIHFELKLPNRWEGFFFYLYNKNHSDLKPKQKQRVHQLLIATHKRKSRLSYLLDLMVSEIL